MQPSNPSAFSERGYEADQLRVKVMRIALTYGAEYFRQRQELNASHGAAARGAGPDELDAAVLELADKLREPDHCTLCGQVVPPASG